MTYTSYVYLVLFLGITFLFYTVFPKKYKWTILLAASYIYYIAASRWWLVIFIFLTSLTIYLCAIWLDKINDIFSSVKNALDRDQKKVLKEKVVWQKKMVVVLMLIIVMGTLAFLKYFNFFTESLNFMIFSHIQMEIPMLKLFLPLGISFYTLQAVSYVIDVYRGKYKADYKFTRVALYLVFFPTIVEGPIAKYDQVAHQIYEGHSFHYENMTYGVQLILWGMFKKIVIADRANMLVNHVFNDSVHYAGLSVVFAIAFYTIQLYTEFSGCMDIVRGSAQLFSIHLPENFKQPFFAKSINEFWQRWHITLGAWLKDYVFYSVSLSKPFKKFSQFVKGHTNEYFAKLLPATTALFFVWIGNGLWHGASLKYVVYGMYYYFLMVFGMFMEPIFMKILKALHINKEARYFKWFQVARTIVIVNIGMLIFRADTLHKAFDMFISCFRNFSFDIQPLLQLGLGYKDILVVLFGVIVIWIAGIFKEKGIHIRETIGKWNIVPRWIFYFVAVFIVIIFGAYGRGYDIVSFIYAQF